MAKNFLQILTIGLVLSFFSSCGYNDMVSKREAVNKAWGEVEADYQRRADLIPNIVASVKGQANFEEKTLVDLKNAEAAATQTKIDISKATPEQLADYDQKQGMLGQAMSRIMVQATQNYPNLQTNTAFQDLRVELEGSENRINTARIRYNEVVADYNAYIKSIPQSFFAGSFGFTEKPYFKSDAAAAKAPQVSF